MLTPRSPGSPCLARYPATVLAALVILAAIPPTTIAAPITGSVVINYNGSVVTGDPLLAPVTHVQTPGAGNVTFSGFNPYSPPSPIPWEFASTPYVVASAPAPPPGGCGGPGATTAGCLLSSTSPPGAVDSLNLNFATTTMNLVDDVDEIFGAWIAGVFLFHLDPAPGSFGAVGMSMTTTYGGGSDPTRFPGFVVPLSMSFGSGMPTTFSGGEGFTFGGLIPGVSPISGGPMWLAGGWVWDFTRRLIEDGTSIATVGALMATIDPAFIEILPFDTPLAPPEFLLTLPTSRHSFTARVVPEPASLLLWATAAAMAGRRLRRRPR